MNAPTQPAANILHSYRARFKGQAVIVATDGQGNVLNRADRRVYRSQQLAAKRALRADFKGFDRGTAFRAVPYADLALLGCS